MSQANNIKGLVRNLDKIVSKDMNEQWYVPIYEKELNKIRKELLFAHPSETFFIAGQSGNGKTTALSFLVNDDVKDKFRPIYISSTEFSANIYDFNMADILYGLSIELIKLNTNSALFLEDVGILKKIHDGEIEEKQLRQVEQKYLAKANIEASAGFKFWSFFGFKSSLANNISYNKNAKKIIRETISAKIKDFLKILNDIIFELESKKPLLVIIDDLEKIRNLEQIRALFIEQRFIFDRINCIKIITIPGHLPENAQFRANTKLFYLGKKIKKSPFSDLSSKEQEVAKTKKELATLINKRINKNVKIIHPKVLQKAVDYSMGIPNLLIQIIREAAINALEGFAITELDIDMALDEIKLNYMPTLSQGGAVNEVLFSIFEKNIPTIKDDNEKQLFNEAILANQIVIYYDKIIWYDINSTIRREVELYYKLSK